MTENTATRHADTAAKKPAARLLSVVSKLKSAALNAIARHQRREVSLRVHRATRRDGGSNGAGAAASAYGGESSPAVAGGDGSARPRPFARAAKRLRRFFEAHAARLQALRVYDRTRG